MSASLAPLPQFPSLWQINTRVWMTSLSRQLDRPATLDDVPDAELDLLVDRGIDIVWLLSVWQTSPASQGVSRTHGGWRQEFVSTLADLTEDDIGGSGFAIRAYEVAASLGGEAALARLRARLAQRGLRLLLDFVPNHMGLDHPWLQTHPEFFIEGNEELLAREPDNYAWLLMPGGSRIFAYGRDPYFSGWPDTLQLDYSQPGLVAAMIDNLRSIATQCDGVRCDMAMLILPQVFERTWRRTIEPFWPQATAAVREASPDFLFLAEVYWDLEWELQHQGFDYTYDKRLYDRLRHGSARGVHDHLVAGLDFQSKCARFLENHDEPRAAAVFPHGMHEAAAVATYFTPGLRFFQAGQREGKQKRVSPHLIREPDELIDRTLATFYDRLWTVLEDPLFREGTWQLLTPRAAWDENATWENFLGYAWHGPDGALQLVVIHYAGSDGQCYLPLPFPELAGRTWKLTDRLHDIDYIRNGDDLLARGLYLDMPAWGYHVFDLEGEEE